MKTRIMILFALMSLTLALLPAGRTLAQANLMYGSTVTGMVDAATPLAFYTFNGVAGDLVSIRLTGFEPSFTPLLTLNGPTQAQVASSDNDPFSPNTGGARIDYRLTEDGVYTILVTGGMSSGQFVLRLDGQGALPIPPLTVGQQVALVDVVSSTRFNLIPQPGGPQVFSFSSATPGFSFQATVRNLQGDIVAVLQGDEARPAQYVLRPDDFGYDIEFSRGSLTIEGVVTVGLSNVCDVAAVAPPTFNPPPYCAASSVQPVNVRRGPSTDEGVLAQLQPGQFYRVTGVNNGWYSIEVPGFGAGWVRNDVVVISGPCSLGVSVTPSPTPIIVTATPIPTMTMEPVATEEMTQEPMPTETPVAFPVVPERFRMQLTQDDLDQTFSNALPPYSWHRVAISARLDVDNPLQEYNVRVVCSGPGAGDVVWGVRFEDGPVPTDRRCGDSFNVFFNLTNEIAIHIRMNVENSANYSIVANPVG